MDAIKDILKLGGYGAYVWPAFGTWAAVMAWMVISTLRRLRAAEGTLGKLQAARGSRRGTAVPGAGSGNTAS